MGIRTGFCTVHGGKCTLPYPKKLHRCGISERVEHGAVRTCHPDLRVEACNGRKQCRAAVPVEMRRDFVQQDQGSDAARHLFYKAGLGKRKAYQQRLLFACGTHFGGHGLGAVRHFEIAPVRPNQSAASLPVAAPVPCQKLHIGSLYPGFGRVPPFIGLRHIRLFHCRGCLRFEMTLQRQHSPGERGIWRTGALGFYRPSDNRSAFFELSTYPPIAMWLEAAKDTRLPYKQRQIARNKLNQWVEFNNMTVIQHEAGHHIDFNIGLFPSDVFNDPDSFDSIPRWLVEGTTMMFEFPPTKAGASLGTVNHGRLDEFDKIYGRKDEHRRLSPQQLKTFILDNSVFLRGGGSTYSLGWALVYYCWKEKRREFGQYVQIIAQREPGFDVSYTQREREFEDLLGRVDEDWIDDWYEFLDGLLLKKSVLPPDIRP